MLGIWSTTFLLACARNAVAQADASIPDYVLTYAPLVYLDVNEQYYPSDIATQLVHTYPAFNTTALSNAPSALSLSNLTTLNTRGNCTSFANCNIFLTSKDKIQVNDQTASWLRGVLPNPSTGETEGATSCAVIVRNHNDESKTVDAFYMYFYAFNGGLPAVGEIFDNHVGDWEHTMVRFVNGQPQTVYFSVHSSGVAYTYDAVLKDSAGKRPLGFASKGGHATYPQEGQHPLYGGVANDSTSRGPLWDPVAGSGAWYYTFTPDSGNDSNGTFAAVNVANRSSRGTGPVNWLYFLGRWGDAQYNASYPGQMILTGVSATFESGPTGPLDKDLVRSQACPDGSSCVTMSSVAAASGSSIAQTVSRTFTSASTTPTVTTTRAGSTSATSSSGGPTSTGAAMRSNVKGGFSWDLCLGLCMLAIM